MPLTRENKSQILSRIDRFVREKFYDPNFNGRDWGQLVVKYRERISDKNSRYRAIAQEYVASTGRTLIVSPDNESRQALNRAVREELKLSGPEYRQQNEMLKKPEKNIHMQIGMGM